MYQSKVDSSRLSIPLSECEVKNTQLTDQITTLKFNEQTGEQIASKTKLSEPIVIETKEGTYFKVYLDSQFTYVNGKQQAEQYLTILANSKLLKKDYFTGITKDTFKDLYCYVMNTNTFMCSYDSFKNARYNDTDICFDFKSEPEDFKKLHKNLKTTMVYVTHDQTEAMSLGTKIAIMNNGKIEQFDTPKNIYNKPSSVFVADFVGSPSMNFIKGSLTSNNKLISFLPDNASENETINFNHNKELQNNSAVLFGIRPEHIFLKKTHAARVAKDENFAEIKVKTELHEYIGHEQIITFSYLGQELLGKFASSIDVEIDKEMTLFIDLNNISIFDKDTKQRI